MIWNDQNKGQKNGNSSEMSDHQFGIVILLVACAFIWKITPFVIAWYHRNFYKIWCVAILAAFAFSYFIYLRIQKKFAPQIEKRARLQTLKPSEHSVLAAMNDNDKIFHVPFEARTGHVQIIGSTGRGKTESVVLPWAYRDVVAGRSALVIDGKGGDEIVSALKEASEISSERAEFYLFNLTDLEKSCTINPLASGSSQQITDRIFSAFDFDESYYRAVQYEICGMMVSLLHNAGIEVTYEGLYIALTDDMVFRDLISKCQEERLNKFGRTYLAESPQDRKKKLAGLISQLGPFAIGEISSIVNGRKHGRKHLDFASLISETPQARQTKGAQGQFAAVILLPTLSYQNLAHQLGKMILQDLGFAVSKRVNPYPTSVFLDEFASFVYPGFTNILNKARSSGVALHLSHQALSDLSSVSEDFAKTVNTNTNVKCILGVNDPETAEFFASHFGTTTAEKVTEQADNSGFFGRTKRTGMKSIREVEVFKIHPNRLKNFTRGRGVLHLPSAFGNITEEVQFLRLGNLDH
jgi:hypothetical protein